MLHSNHGRQHKLVILEVAPWGVTLPLLVVECWRTEKLSWFPMEDDSPTASDLWFAPRRSWERVSPSRTCPPECSQRPSLTHPPLTAAICHTTIWARWRRASKCSRTGAALSGLPSNCALPPLHQSSDPAWGTRTVSGRIWEAARSSPGSRPAGLCSGSPGRAPSSRTAPWRCRWPRWCTAGGTRPVGSIAGSWTAWRCTPTSWGLPSVGGTRPRPTLKAQNDSTRQFLEWWPRLYLEIYIVSVFRIPWFLLKHNSSGPN